MKDVTGLFAFLLLFLLGRASGMEESSGYCTGSQCFIVYQQPSTFTTAQINCEQQEGHLMTVRTAASDDILISLLGNLTGKFWIGLHQPSGCPERTSTLSGFQWVTGDTDTAFTNWAEGFDMSCSEKRCVSVSRQDGFSWEPTACEEQPLDGFLCEHSFTEPCHSLTPVPGETVSYRTPLGFGGEDLPSLPPGTTATRMPSQAAFLCFSQQWLPAPWSCEIMEGGCEHRCAVDPNNRRFCYCPEGQGVDPANKVTCSSQEPGDPCLELQCAHFCYREDDSSRCTCDQGFQLAADRRSCVDFNDCRDARQCPGKNFVCVNTVGGFECLCAPGYRPSGDLCVDVNECVEAPCEHVCTNTPGRYTCSCYEGHRPQPEAPHRCERHCGAEECPAECDPNNHQQCYCPRGYVVDERADGVFCIDMDECTFFYCDQDCENTFGGYMCSCSPGFRLVEDSRCVKSGDEDPDLGPEGSGMTAAPPPSTPPPGPRPGPTRRPSAVTAGGLVGILVCAVFSVGMLVLLVYHLFRPGEKMESSALKAAEGETHGLEKVDSDS